MGIVVLALLVFLLIFIFTRHERIDSQYAENDGISENKEAGVAKVVRDANVGQSSLEQPKISEAPAKEASTPL